MACKPNPLLIVAGAIRQNTDALNALTAWLMSHADGPTKQDMLEMEKRMAIKVSEIKAAVAKIKQNNQEALGEIGRKIADLNKQIKDLIEGVGDPDVTDEQFEADLKELGTDSQALADIVSGSPT